MLSLGELCFLPLEDHGFECLMAFIKFCHFSLDHIESSLVLLSAEAPTWQFVTVVEKRVFVRVLKVRLLGNTEIVLCSEQAFLAVSKLVFQKFLIEQLALVVGTVLLPQNFLLITHTQIFESLFHFFISFLLFVAVSTLTHIYKLLWKL